MDTMVCGAGGALFSQDASNPKDTALTLHNSPPTTQHQPMAQHATPPALHLKANPEPPTLQPSSAKQLAVVGAAASTSPQSTAIAQSVAPSSQPQRHVNKHQPHYRSYEEAIASAAGSVVPPEMRCRYKTGRCPLARAMKRSGRPLLLCEFHRSKQNSIKRKSDTKYRIDRLAQKAKDATHPPAETQPAPPLDFDSCLSSDALHIPLIPLPHEPMTPLQQLISPTSDMGGEDIALLQFFMLTPR